MKRLLSTIIEKIQNDWWVACKVLPPKKPLIMCMVLICIAASLCSGGQTAQAAPHTVAIVFDTSPTSHDTELRWAALSFYRNCTAGDRVLFFAVRGKNTRLMFSCTKTLQESEFADMAAIVNDVDTDWLAHADLSAALSGPIYQQLRQRCGKNEHAIAVVVSTGNFSDEQAKDLCTFGSTIKNNNKWALVITGLVDKTPRRVFLSATKGELYWYNLAEAIYGTMVDRWLKDIKYELTDKPTQPERQPDLFGTTIKQPAFTHTDISKSDSNEAKKIGNTTAQNPQSKADVVAQPSQEKPRAKTVKTKLNSTLSPLPAFADTNSQKVGTPAGIAKDAQKEKSPVVATPHAAEPNASFSKSPHIDANAKTPPTAKTPANTTKDINVPRHGPAGKPPKGNSFAGNTVPWGEFAAPLFTIAGVVIAVVIFLIAWRSWNRAKNWKKTAKQRIDTFTNKPRHLLEILMAQVGEASYRLGNLQHFRRVYVGNSAKNAIRIDRKGIIDRHLKIYRRFSSLRIKNLSTKSMMVNGHQLVAGKKMKLLLPAEIIACEGVMIRLFVNKMDVSKTVQLQETSDGTRK